MDSRTVCQEHTDTDKRSDGNSENSQNWYVSAQPNSFRTNCCKILNILFECLEVS